MSDLRAQISGTDQVWITDGTSGARLEFTIVTDKAGRRHLDCPHGSVDKLADGEDLLRQACVLARSEALHAGKVHY